ncbi:MAG TPA: hypothetical protein VGC09_11735 [Rhodopila sp.]
MRTIIAEDRTLCATLCEVERGLFHVTYRSDPVDPGILDLPRYQLGGSGFEARQHIERLARTLGYNVVVWTAPFGAPGPFGDPAVEGSPLVGQ